MISREDLKNISISINEYGGGWYDSELYYKGKLLVTYKCSGHVRTVINEENYRKLELDEKIEQELKEFYPIELLPEKDREEAKALPNKFDTIQFIRSKMPNEGLKGAKAYYDLYISGKIE